MQALGGGLRSLKVAADQQAAVLIAQSLLDEAVQSTPLNPGLQEGEAERDLSYRIEIDEFLEPDEHGGAALYRVTVEVLRESEVLVALQTLRQRAQGVTAGEVLR